MGRLYVMIYCLPLHIAVILAAELLFVWYLLGSWFMQAGLGARRGWAVFRALLLAAWLAGILHMTVFSRSGGSVQVLLEPFHQLRAYWAGGDRELLRTLAMNVLLFLPGGLLLASLWPGRWPGWARMALTVVLLAALSAGVEAVQYRYALGCVETDDVLCNALGALLGAAAHQVCGWAAARYIKNN